MMTNIPQLIVSIGILVATVVQIGLTIYQIRQNRKGAEIA